MEQYALVLSEAAGMSFAEASHSEQRRLVPILDQMKAMPFRHGDLQERDAYDRENQILIFGDWIVTYWPDHAAREMRIVRLERASG